MKYVLIFLFPFLITFSAVFFYFRLKDTITIPTVSIKKLIGSSDFSLEVAPSESLKGTIATMSGEVKWENRVATEAAVLKNFVGVEQGESLETGKDGVITVQFSDKAKITLGASSHVEIVQTLPVDLVFFQTLGQIEYIKTGDSNVSIRIKHLLIENAGDIEVLIDKVKPIVQVSVKSGSAKLAYNDSDNISQIVEVLNGETAAFNDDSRQVVIK